MKDEFPELAPDLEWMLQGRQASQALILETLIHEYSPQVTRLTYSILGEQSQALYAALDTFTMVLENRHHYYGKTNVKLFIYAQAVEVCRRYLREKSNGRVSRIVERLPEPEKTDQTLALVSDLSEKLRIPLVLHYAHRLTIEEIAVILRTTPRHIQNKIQKAVLSIQQNLAEISAVTQPVEEHLSVLLGNRWYLPIPDDLTEAQMVQAVEFAIEKRKQSRGARLYLIQAALGGALLVGIIVIGILTNRGTSSQIALPPVPRTYVVTQLVHVPVYITPTPPLRLRSPINPLTINSSREEIRQRIIESEYLWSTLWADAYVYDYGPAGYVGPPYIRREQIWINQPDRGLLISGEPSGRVDKTRYLSGNFLYPLLDLFPQYFYYSRNYLPSDILHTYLIFQPTSWARTGMPMSIVETINTLGRDALVVDVSTKTGSLLGRLTVDSELGIILAIRLYGQDGITVLADIYLDKLAVDVEFPEHIFDPNQLLENFYLDYNAQAKDLNPAQGVLDIVPTGHASYPKTLPPPGFNIYRSYLTMQWSQQPFGQDENMVIIPVDLFTDGYYRGHIKVGNPWSAVCERSPDGRYLALIEQPDQVGYPSYRIHWLSLNDIGAEHELLPKGSQYGGDVAFSPDSNTLAFWGCGVREDNCGVYLLNLNNQKLKKLLPGGYAGYFLWSSDGKELAMLTEDDSLVVVDATSGQVTYKEYMDWISFVIPQDAPVLSWGIAYPPIQRGLQGCDLPGG